MNLVTVCVSWSRHTWFGVASACDVLTATNSALMPEGSLSAMPAFSAVYITALHLGT